jgi:putative aldouronate transport system substrate-binding protein
MKRGRLFLIPALFIMAAGLIYAGGGAQEPPPPPSPPATVKTGGLPISEKPITLKVVTEVSAARTMSNQLRTIQELTKRTNIQFEWEALPLAAADRTAKYNAIIASGDIPDILGSQYAGINFINRYGMEGIFLPLNDLITRYAPNIRKVFDNPLEGDEIPYKMNAWGEVTAKDGKIYNIPLVSASNAIGPVWVLRTDWLKKLGLKTPETADELYAVLKAFKEKDPNGNGQADEIPLGAGEAGKTARILPLVNAFDAHMGFYVDQKDGKIKYGPIEPAFKTALAYINKLYAEGLLESDYLTADRNKWLARAGGNQMGMQFVWPGSGLGNSNRELAKLNPDFHFEPIPPLKSPSGKQYKDITTAGNAIAVRSAVGAKTKYPAEIMRLFDYCFSPEGELLANWGVEGETYTMVNGKPKWTDYILKNPEGKDNETAQILFGMRWHLLPYQNRWEPNFQATELSAPFTLQAWKIYMKSGTVEAPMPSLPLTEDELSRRASLATEIATYADPMIDKFIMGQEPLSRFDEFTANIKRAGLDQLLVLLNQAYDAYKANSK